MGEGEDTHHAAPPLAQLRPRHLDTPASPGYPDPGHLDPGSSNPATADREPEG